MEQPKEAEIPLDDVSKLLGQKDLTIITLRHQLKLAEKQIEQLRIDLSVARKEDG